METVENLKKYDEDDEIEDDDRLKMYTRDTTPERIERLKKNIKYEEKNKR